MAFLLLILFVAKASEFNNSTLNVCWPDEAMAECPRNFTDFYGNVKNCSDPFYYIIEEYERTFVIIANWVMPFRVINYCRNHGDVGDFLADVIHVMSEMVVLVLCFPFMLIVGYQIYESTLSWGYHCGNMNNASIAAFGPWIDTTNWSSSDFVIIITVVVVVMVLVLVGGESTRPRQDK